MFEQENVNLLLILKSKLFIFYYIMAVALKYENFRFYWAVDTLKTLK